jgi:hypothetical protein
MPEHVPDLEAYVIGHGMQITIASFLNDTFFSTSTQIR